MAQLAGVDEIESELAEIGRSIRSSFRSHASSFWSMSRINRMQQEVDNDAGEALQRAEIQRLPTFERITSASFDVYDGMETGKKIEGKQVVDVSKLGAQERLMFIEKLIKHIENDNLRLLQKFRQRIDKNSQQDVFNVFGAMYYAALFFGINNCSTVLPYVATERTVLYRERFAGMYSPWAYSFAQVLIEVPYIFIQAVVDVLITYPMLGYDWSAYKIFWSFFSMFCNILYYNYLGMLIVSLTPNVQLASIVASSSYTTLNLFSGYFVPRLRIPKWWIWMYYLCPMSWALNGMLTSQYGDVNKKISAFEEKKTIAKFLEDYYGFHHDFLGVVGVVLIFIPIVIVILFAYCIANFNFQKR